MIRPVFNGSLVFGPISIPVKAYSYITEQNDIAFHTVHAKCGNKLNQHFHCQSCNLTIPRQEALKAYEDKITGALVSFEQRELDLLVPEPDENRPIVLEQTATISDIPQWYEKHYYIAPANLSSHKAYTLFFLALKNSGLCGIVTYISHGRHHLGLLSSNKDGLILRTLHYAARIRDMREVIPEIKIQYSKQELTLVQQFIKRQQRKFDHPIYVDQYQIILRDAIQRKIDGEVVPEVQPIIAQKRGEIVDLVHALRESMKPLPSAAKKAKQTQVVKNKRREKLG